MLIESAPIKISRLTPDLELGADSLMFFTGRKQDQGDKMAWIKSVVAAIMVCASGMAAADAALTDKALIGNWECEFAFKVGDKFSVNFSGDKFSLKLKSETVDGNFAVAGDNLQLKPANAAKAALVADQLPAKVFQYTEPAELVLGDGTPETYCNKK